MTEQEYIQIRNLSTFLNVKQILSNAMPDIDNILTTKDLRKINTVVDDMVKKYWKNKIVK